MIPTTYYFLLSATLFGIGLVGLAIHRNNLITLLMCIELMLLGVNTNFVGGSLQHADISGQIFVFFILTVAAAEAAIGLAIIVLLYRHKKDIHVETFHSLKG